MLGADSLEVFKRLGHVRFPGAPDGIRLLGARPRAPQGGPGGVVRPSGLPRWAHCITLYITERCGPPAPARARPPPGPPGLRRGRERRNRRRNRRSRPGPVLVLRSCRRLRAGSAGPPARRDPRDGLGQGGGGAAVGAGALVSEAGPGVPAFPARGTRAGERRGLSLREVWA